MFGARIEIERDITDRIVANFPAAVATCVNRAVARAIEVADPKTPVDKGPLRANKVITDATPASIEAEIHWTQFYAGYQNFGTVRGIVGQRFADQGAAAGERLLVQDLARLEGML